ncbi:MAG TPA: hypothetical protein VL523_18435 [Terriglobia bacterium]|nr:hypothetical protein [Terriglobia bacterium]
MKTRILTCFTIAVALSIPAALFGQAAAEYGAHIGRTAAPAARAASGLGRASNAMAGRAAEQISRSHESARQVYDRRVAMGRPRAAAASANSMPARAAAGFKIETTAVDCSAVDLTASKEKAGVSSVQPACVKAGAPAPNAAQPDATKYPAAITISFKKN